jgi:hypothetical protein
MRASYRVWAQRHEGVLGEWRYSSTRSLTSSLDGGEWSASRPSHFPPRERAPGIHWIGGWVGPRAVLDAVVKRKIPSPRRESNSRTPIVQPVAQCYTDWAITALVLTSLLLANRISACCRISDNHIDQNNIVCYMSLLRTGCWGKYFDLRGRKWRGGGGGLEKAAYWGAS